LRGLELVKIPALTLVCNLALKTRVFTGLWIIFHRAPTFFWCSRSSRTRWALHPGTSGERRGETCRVSPGHKWPAAFWKAHRLCES